MSLTTSLRAYYKFDSNNATQVDSVGNYNLSVSGATYTASGKLNGAYSYDGTNDSINGSFQNTADELSINVWIKKTDIVGTEIFVTLNSHWEVYASGDDIYIYVKDAADTNAMYTSKTNILTSGSWHMITAVIDTTEAVNNDKLKIYFDGVLQTTTMSGTAISDLYKSSDTLYVGARAAQYYLEGDIDEVGIWDRILTSAEITKLYNSGSGLSYDAFNNRVRVEMLGSC